jgi:hypothetical protein
LARLAIRSAAASAAALALLGALSPGEVTTLAGPAEVVTQAAAMAGQGQ